MSQNEAISKNNKENFKYVVSRCVKPRPFENSLRLSSVTKAWTLSDHSIPKIPAAMGRNLKKWPKSQI